MGSIGAASGLGDFAITNFVLKITLFPLFRAFRVAINVYALLSSIFYP